MIPRAVPVWMLAGICGNYKMSFLVGASLLLGLGVETPDLEGVAACLAHQPGERGAVLRARPGDDPRESGAARTRYARVRFPERPPDARTAGMPGLPASECWTRAAPL